MIPSGAIHPWVAENSARVGFGLTIGALGDWSQVRETAQMAEELGFDSLWLPDHPLQGWDSWTILAGLAEATKRVRLGAMVTCVFYRHPVQLARVVADVDRISGGRVVLALGSGDMPLEFRQMGMEFLPPRERGAALEEALRIVPPLLRGEEVEFEGRTFKVNGARLQPAATQHPHVPVLIAGGGRTALRLVAQYADASSMAAASWAGGVHTPEDARKKFDALRSNLAETGRSFDAILRTTQVGLFLADTAAEAARFEEALHTDPLRGRAMAFLEGIPSFSTVEGAVERLITLQKAEFQYFVMGSAVAMGNLQRLVDQVLTPVRQLGASPSASGDISGRPALGA